MAARSAPSPVAVARVVGLVIGLFLQATASAADAPRAPEAEGKAVSAAYAALLSRAEARATDAREADLLASQRLAARYTAWTRWMPRLDLQLSQARSIDYSLATSGALASLPFAIVPEWQSLSRWQFSLTMPLYRRSVHLGVLAAQADLESARAARRARRAELDARLRSLVGAWLLAEYRLATGRGSLELARKNLAEAQLRFKLGQKTKVDVLRAHANLTTLESRELGDAGSRESALNAVQEFAALSREQVLETGFGALAGGAKAEPRLDAAIRSFSDVEAVRARLAPELEGEEDLVGARLARSGARFQAIVAEEAAAEARAESIAAEVWPELAFNATLGKQAEGWTQALRGSDHSKSFALTLTLPLFSGGSAVSTWLEKDAAGETARLRRERDQLRLLNEVKERRLRSRTLALSIEGLELALAQRQEIERLSFKSYQLGRLGIVDLLSSQDELARAKVELASARLELAGVTRQLAADLGVSMGGEPAGGEL